VPHISLGKSLLILILNLTDKLSAFAPISTNGIKKNYLPPHLDFTQKCCRKTNIILSTSRRRESHQSKKTFFISQWRHSHRCWQFAIGGGWQGGPNERSAQCRNIRVDNLMYSQPGISIFIGGSIMRIFLAIIHRP